MSPPLERLLRPGLRTLAPYVPGTTVREVRERFGIAAPVKLSQNENPFGTSPRALAALRSLDDVSVYVEDDHRSLRERLARPYGLEIENVVCGHGSNELVAALFTAFVDPGDEVVMAVPTFSLFRSDCTIAGGRAIEVPLRDGVHDLDAMLRAVGALTKLVFVCDPNNPTGTSVRRDAMLAFASALPPDVLLVIDQAYREYCGPDTVDGVEILRRRPATMVLRTASKIYGLAAVRFGYGYTSPEVERMIARVRLPFNVGAPAAAAVLAALDDREFFERTRANNDAGKAYLMREFERLGLDAYASEANFVAVRVPASAARAYEELLERGIVVRSGAGLGMPDRLRVSIGTPPQNEAFVAALERLLPVWRSEAAPAAAS